MKGGGGHLFDMEVETGRSIEVTGVGVEYHILGPVAVRVDDRDLDLGPKKQRSLFALLLINHNRTVSTDRILDALWGDDADGKENALWVYISRLRSILDEVSAEPVLITKDHGYSLEIDPESLDAAEFERLSRKGLAALNSDPPEAADTLEEALDLWRGNPLEDFAYDEFARSEIARLTELRRTTLDARIEADLMCGKTGELVGTLEQQVDGRPYDETPMRQLMLALYRSGRQTDALRAFERFRKRLAEDTGTEPTPELRRLEEQILFHDSRLASTVADAPRRDVQNPYRGLEAFREEDAHLFFGRDTLVAELLARIAEHSIVAVVGPSGCGKSSAVRSGVIPAVRKAALPGSDEWLLASMIPGTHPFVELEAALLRSRLDAPESLRSHLDGSPDEILRGALRITPSESATVLIVVDQFEELFTVCDPATADRFLTGIVEAARDPRMRVRFVLTLRADFYDRPLRHPAFGTALASGITNVVPMAPEELEQAAAGPAQRVGVRLEPGLEAALIGDVLGQPGALPLFEFALTDLFDRRVGDTLTLDTYRTMGGIEGTLSRKAEHLYDRLTSDQQSAARQVFLRLVSISNGETRSRRRVDASELLGLGIDISDLQVVLDTFGSQRLLSFDRSDVTGSPTVEVAHEALLEHWERLTDWVTDAKHDVKQNARLSALAAEWEDHDRDNAYLLSEGRYNDYAAWADEATLTLARPERDYLEASRQAYEDRERSEADRLAKEHATTRRARRNAWSLVAVVVAVVVVGGYFVWSAVQPEGPSVVLVHRGGDQTAIDAMVLSGFDRAAAELDIEARDEVVLSDMEERLRELAEEGTEVIIGGIDYSEFVLKIHQEYPDTQFVITDTLGQPKDNVSAAAFNDHAGAYVAGVAAAHTTTTGTVGIVTSAQILFMTQFAGGYDAGVASVDPSIDVLIDFVSTRFVIDDAVGAAPAGWFDRAGVYDAAWTMYDKGADVVFTAAGDAGTETIRAAHDYTELTGRHVWAIGVDIDEGFTTDQSWSDHVLTSMVKNWDEAIYLSVEAYLAGSLDQGVTLGFDNGGISLSRYGGNLEPILAEVEAVEADLAAGLLDFSWAPRTQVSWREPATDSVRATFDGSSVVFDRNPAVGVGETVEFVVDNQSADWVDCGVAFMQPGVTRADLEESFDSSRDVGEASLLLGGFPTFSWTVEPGHQYDIRSFIPEGPFATGGLACWPSLDWANVSFSELFPIAS